MMTPDPTHGSIDLSGSQFRGSPFLAPLYGPPPYQYVDDVVLIVVYEADPAALREVLPADLAPLPEHTVAMCFFLCPEVSGIGPHSFTMPCIPVRHGEFVGQYVPYLYTSTDASLACYREGQGWPALLGQTEIVAAQGRVRARVTRDGREIVCATAEVGGEILTTLDFLPMIFYREFMSADGSRRESAYLTSSTSRFTNIRFQAGSGTLRYGDDPRDPIARLAPRRIVTALYGTMDDLFPETIHLLKRYESSTSI